MKWNLGKWAMILAGVGSLTIGLNQLGFNLVQQVLGGWPQIVTALNWVFGISGGFLIYKSFGGK